MRYVVTCSLNSLTLQQSACDYIIMHTLSSLITITRVLMVRLLFRQTFTSPAAVVISLPICALPVDSTAPKIILVRSTAH